MEVISYADAARLAGVSRAAIADLKKRNLLQKGKYPFFCFSPSDGREGVDVKHPSWLNYLDKRKTRGVKKTAGNQPPNSKERELRKQLEKKDSLIIQFVSTCIDVATDYFKASSKQIEEFKGLIASEFEGMDG